MSDTKSIIQLTAGGITAEHVILPSPPALVAPSVNGKDHNTIRSSIVPFACWRADDMRFDFESSVVRPEIAGEMESLKDIIDRHTIPDAAGIPTHRPALSVFGHADPTGDDEFNKQLSGRRAQAIYAMLTRRVDLWEQLFQDPLGNDDWKRNSLNVMAGELKVPLPVSADKVSRQALFSAYMDHLCTIRGADGKPELNADLSPVQLRVAATDFLAEGTDAGGKGDFQGCGEFNPILVFSAEEAREFSDPKNKAKRDAENAPNRRVVIYLFRPGLRIAPSIWPCPRAKEGTGACRRRFWSDGEDRRNRRLPEDRREYLKTKDTFGCRFYDRLSNASPCEQVLGGGGTFFMQCLSGDGTFLLAKRKYQIRGRGDPTVQFFGLLDDTGALRHERVPSGDYVLTVQGCGSEANIAVLPPGEKANQVCFMEDGRLAIHVLTPDGDAIPDANVVVQGLGTRLTDDEGLAFFSAVQAGEFPFRVTKVNHEPVEIRGSSQRSFRGVTADVPVSATGDGAAVGKATVKDVKSDVIVHLKAKEVVVPPKVVRVRAKQAGTRSRRNPKRSLAENTLDASTSAESSLSANKPVVLLKGSRSVFLSAVTDPPGAKVTWEVTANENTGAPPTIDPKVTIGDPEKLPEGVGPNLTELSTDQTGSFSVTATVDKTSIVWNVVFVAVEVDESSPVDVRQEGLVDLGEFSRTPEGKKVLQITENKVFDRTLITGPASGLFEFGKHAWSSEVRVKLRGGGSSGTLGTDQVIVRVVQNVDADRVVGEYETENAVIDTVDFPQLDTSKGSPDGYDGPAVGAGVRVTDGKVVPHAPFLWADGMFKEVKNTAGERVFKVGDSPATGFATKSPKNEKLTKIRGDLRFRDGVAAFSKSSINEIVVYADLFWHVDYTGDCDVTSGIGKWSKTSAKVSVTQKWKKVLSSSGVNGTDAGNAQFEVFPPHAIDDNNRPKKFIKKA